MVGARLSALVALLLLAVSSQVSVSAQESCKEDVLGLSSIIGSKQKGSLMVDHSDLATEGPITRVSLYYSKERGCLKAAKAAFGDPPVPGVIGSTADSTEHALKLQPGEVITKAEYKADKCIKYLKLTTSKARSVSAGHVGPVADVMTSAPTAGSGQLLAIKGSTKPNQGKKHGALQHLQLVWGSTKCTKVSTAAADFLKPESGTLSDGAAAAASGPGACKPRVDMCNEKASMNAFTYCVWNAPFTGSSCRGGCCFSSGKCASSSCAISGMGRDVPNMICYGVNSGVGFGGNSNCGGLACKLATPGCTTDAFGGNCVGTVVAHAPREEISPESLKFVGAPCLDATPSDTTLDASGNPASGEEGIYMGKLWTVCDCAEGGMGLPEPASRLLNLTTSRISNFTKNEVLAAFSTFLPQKNVTDEADPNGKGKVVTLLPSFAEMFKFPSLSSISLPNFIGNLTGAKGGKDGSVSAPKLPDLQGLLGQIKPDDATSASTPGLNYENGALPNGTKAELMMVKPEGSAASEKPPRTLGSLLSRFTKPKEESNGDGSSTFTPGTTEADKSSTKVKPMTLGSLLGGLRRAGPDTSTATAGPAAGPTGNSTRKLDLAPIGALISKFINGPQAAATPAAAPAAASTSAAPANASAAAPAVDKSAPAKPATAAKIQAVQPGPAPVQPAKPPGPAASPAPRAPGPAKLEAPKKGTFHVPPTGTPTPESAQDALPVDPNHIAGDPKDRPKTLGERVREQKLAKAAGKEVPADPAPVPAQPKVQVSRSRFSAPGIKRPQDDPIWVATGMTEQTLMLNLQALTAALQTGAGAGADDLMRFGDLLAQLQKVPGGLGALPADVSSALMTLAAEVNRVTSGGAPTAAEPAAEQPAATPTPAAEQPAATPAAAPAAEAKPADKPAEKPAAAAAPAPAPAAATAAPAATAGATARPATGTESKEQPRPQQQQPEPVKASLASVPDRSSSSSKEVPTVAPAVTAPTVAAPAAVLTASKPDAAAADSKRDSTPPAAAAGQAAQTAAVTADSRPADSKPAALAAAAAAAPSTAKPAEVAPEQPKAVSKQQ